MKKVFKKSFAVFFSAVLLLSVLPFTVSAAEIVDSGTTGSCTWTLDSEGVLTISGNGKMADYHNSNTKWSNSGLSQVVIEEGVTSIGSYAFYHCDRLTEVTIPGSVTSIGNYAFQYCNSLTEVTIPDSVTSIGDHVFHGCSSLTTVTIPDSVTTIGDNAFGNCDSLTAVTIPDSVTSIYNGAFHSCNSLTSVTIPDSVTTIGLNVFSHCTDLTTVSIPDSVTYIPLYTFEGCHKLASITVDPNNPTYDSRNNCNAIIETESNQLIIGCRTTEIPDTVTSIGRSAFCDMISNSLGAFDLDMVTIEIPGSVVSIGPAAFDCCDALEAVHLSEGLTSIDDWAFEACRSLTDIAFPESLTSIGDYAFRYCTYLDSISIPANVSTIGEEAFASCSGLTGITVDPDNPVYDSRNNCNAIIETASNLLIAGCNNTIIPDGVTSIGASAFEDCEGLKTIVLPNSVTTIGKEAFQWCSGLTGVFIPDSVTAIDKGAFYYCFNLTIYGIAGSYAETYANQNNIPFVAVTDFGTTGDCVWWLDSAGTLNVSGDGKMANYPNSLNLPWGTDRVNTAVFEDGVTNIGKCAFKNNTGLQSVTIPDSVTAINSFAFYGCTALQTITIPSSVTSIGTSVFDNCNNLTIYGVKGSYAETFAGQNNIPFVAVCPSCGSTETEVIPAVAATYTQAGTTAGIRCKNCGEWFVEPKIVAKLEEEIVNSGTTGDCTWTLDSGGTLTVSGSGNMGNYANSLNLPWGSDQVKAVIIEDGVTSIGKCAFKNNKGLQSITIPDSVTAVKSFAFYGCSSLQTILIPPSVTDIGLSSFSYCNSLIIFGEKGSYAESNAAQNSIPFVPVCPVCGNSDFEVIPGGTDGSQEMYCTHCNKWTVLPEMAPMAAVNFTVGDLGGDGVLTIDDATLLQQVLAEFIELDLEDEMTFLQADTNGDGYVNVKDVTAIQRKVAELI